MPAMITMSLMLLAAQQATGIGSGPVGPGTPPAMPVTTGGEVPGSPGSTSRHPGVMRSVTPERVESYRASVAERRSEAEAMAAAARTGGLGAEQSAAIRAALEADMHAWREAFQVSGREWSAHADQWLGEPGSMSAAQWAARRASWHQTRDQWIAAKQAR